MKIRNSEWFEWIKAFVIAFIIIFIIRTFFFAPIIVDGPSMIPTLHDRDQMFVNKFIYRFREPERFDIIVFHATTEKDFIKRIIGLPGEHVMVQDGILYINGQEVAEPFLENDQEDFVRPFTGNFTLESLPGGYEKIPEGYVLVLGDNRSNSTDSRSLGLIEMDQIVGKASFIYWPIKRIQTID